MPICQMSRLKSDINFLNGRTNQESYFMLFKHTIKFLFFRKEIDQEVSDIIFLHDIACRAIDNLFVLFDR